MNDLSGRMAPSVFQPAGTDRRGAGFGQWQYQHPPAADPAPAATPATPATPAPGTPATSLLERVAEGQALGDGDAAAFEAELNRAVAGAGQQRTAAAPTLDGRAWQRPAVVEPGDLGELAARMRAAREQLAPGGRRTGVVGVAGQDAPSSAELEAMEQQLAALIAQPAAARRPAPEKGSLAERVADLQRRGQGELDPAASLALDGEMGAVFGELNGEVEAAGAAADPFGTYGERPVPIDEQLFERARSNALALSQAEADSFEQQLNQQIAALARDPDAARPALPTPAPAKPAAQAGDDPLANADPAVLLAVLDRLGVIAEQLAGLVAGDDEGAA